MANNVKPGDLAIIVYDDPEENIGAIVQVKERYFFQWASPDSVYWVCETRGRPLMGFHCCDRTGDYVGCPEPRHEIVLADRQLRPIRGLPLEDEVSAPKGISLA